MQHNEIKTIIIIFRICENVYLKLIIVNASFSKTCNVFRNNDTYCLFLANSFKETCIIKVYRERVILKLVDDVATTKIGVFSPFNQIKENIRTDIFTSLSQLKKNI